MSEWTSERPTVEGWYWFKGVVPNQFDGPLFFFGVLEVHDDFLAGLEVRGTILGESWGLCRLDGLWSGPLIQPEEKK